jgi:hypothetical protein
MKLKVMSIVFPRLPVQKPLVKHMLMRTDSYPQRFYQVVAGQEEALKGSNNLTSTYMNWVLEKSPQKLLQRLIKKTSQFKKNMAVNLINYWVDEKNGVVMCLAQAPDSAALINTHKEAHGLIPVSVVEVKQGQ